MDNNELQLLTRIYSTYSDSKEKFIDRNFATNRYYLALCLVLLLVSFMVYAFTPLMLLMLPMSAIGLVVSILWWLNLDSYQFLIKIKYAKVLEKMEESFPSRPFTEEFRAFQEVKKDKKAIVFADLQKGFAFLVLLTFLVIFCIFLAKAFVAIDNGQTPSVPHLNKLNLLKTLHSKCGKRC
jgi:hypothetical protein